MRLVWIRFLSIVLIIALSNCKKKDLEFVFTGQITDATFGGNSANTLVRLFVKPLGAPEQLEGQQTVGSDGRYEIVIPRERIENIRLSFSKVNYFTEGVTIPFASLEVNSPNVYDLAVTAKSWVKFVVKNEPPTSASDEFKLFKYRGRTNCEECCPNDFFYFYGEADTSFVCVNNANDYLGYYYWVVDTQINGQDSVYTTPFDTIVRTFVY